MSPAATSAADTIDKFGDFAFKTLLTEGAKEGLTGSNIPVGLHQDKDRPVMLLPTSGSSGIPKLCIVTDSMLLRRCRPPRFGAPMILYSRLPLRQSVDVLSSGGRIGVCSGGVDRLRDDLRLLRPTVFGDVPAFWQDLQQEFLSDLRVVADGGEAADSEVREGLVRAWRNKRILGNRCKIIIIGGATASSDLKYWMWEVFECQVIDGYGTTEVGGVAAGGVAAGGDILPGWCSN